MNITSTRFTSAAALAAAILTSSAGSALAQPNSPVPRPPGGMRFQGTAGFIDYDRGVAPSTLPLAPLVMFSGQQMETPEALQDGEIQGRAVEINWALLDAVDLGTTTSCTLPLINGQMRELAFVRKETFGENRYVWYGQIAGIPASDFILSRYDDAVVLQVRDYDRKETFMVRFAPATAEQPNRSVLVQLGDNQDAGWCGTGSGAASLPPPAPGDGGDGGIDEGGQGGGGGVGIMSAADPTNVVDVLFLTTPQFRSLFGNVDSQVNARSQLLVSDFNLTTANSGAGVVMRIAGVLNTGYSETASGHDDLANLALARNGLGATPSLRDMVRADHVVLLRATKWPNPDGAGNILGVAYRPSTLDGATASTGYSVVSAEGNQANTFTHEIGHNFGACHDAAQPGCTSAVTASPHGKRWSCNRVACTDHWHTTMAYGNNENACSPSTRVPFFSNPALTYTTPFGCSNFVLGDSISNVANVIQTTRSRVSQWSVGSSRQWTLSTYGGTGNGTYFAPFNRVAQAVGAVQGGSTDGQVFISSGVYSETAAAGRSVVLTNPCVMTVVAGPASGSGPAILR